MAKSLKQLTAGSIQWNLIDRLASQVLYAVTGVILARELSQEDFGLVGAILVFQAFASLFVDSGFSYALIQRKSPSEIDYSSVFWFNLLMATGLYVALWFAAPLIARWFGSDMRLIALARVMFASFIINALAIVQVNRLMKRMDFKPVCLTNAIGLAAGGGVGVWLAFSGFGAWAIVWQTIVSAAVKCMALWVWCRWMPMLRFSWRALAGYFRVGSNMMLTSLLNTIFLNIYSFFIGNRAGLASLGYYTQADKWSKMGVMSVTQVLTSSFLPTLSAVQDDRPRFCRVVSKMNRFTSYLLFPCIFFLIVMATPIFHVLFGEKWDPSIILFRMLLVRGVFTVLNSLYNNYILALGHSRAIFRLEAFRDGAALVGIIVTLPFIAIELPDNLVYGLTIFIAGQVIASVLCYVVTLAVTVSMLRVSLFGFISDMAPYLVSALAISGVMWWESSLQMSDWALLALQFATGLGCYLGLNSLLPSKIQHDVLGYLFHRKTEEL